MRLRGRRTPHQDLEGPLIEITQPSISNWWATGGPPLVLISHPSGMTPDEERFYTENRSTWLSQNWAWMGTPICPHLGRKRDKGMAHYKSPCLSLWRPFLKRHRSLSASVVFYRFQTLLQGAMDANTEENCVFAVAKPKRRRSAAKISAI